MRPQHPQARRGPRTHIPASRLAQTILRRVALRSGLTMRQLADGALEDETNLRLIAQRIRGLLADRQRGEPAADDDDHAEPADSH